MSNLFDTNARASEAVFGGEPAARAVGLPTQQDLPGSLAPGASNAGAQALLGQMRQRTQSLLEEATAQPAREPVLGYNPESGQVFSGGKTFKLDLNEGPQNAQLFEVDNQELPEGFRPVRSSQLKSFLAREYENLGFLDSAQRRIGQATANIGSTLQDLGAESIGQSMQEAGGALAARNPSKITSAADLAAAPLTAAQEAIGEVVGYDVPAAIAQTAAGAAAGAKLGTALAPVTGGLSIPIGAILGGAGARFLGTLFETYGSIRSEQREEGIDDRSRALLAGSGSAALEALLGPEARIASQIVRRGGQEVTERGALSGAANLVDRGRAGKLVKDFFVQGGIEGATEVPQSALERFGAYQPLTGQEATDEYIIGGFKGFVGGAALSPIASTIEFQQAKNFVENLKADMQLAADPTAPSPVRLQAARRAQDVLRGSSDDPQFDAVLQEFRQKLSFIDTQIVNAATQNALASGQAVDLLDTARQKDLFNRAVDQPTPATEFDRTADDFTQWRAAPVAQEETPPVVDATQPGQQELFGPTGEPTYAADPSFGESRFEFNQNLQGPTITPGQRVMAGMPAINETIDQIQSGALEGGMPVTGELTPGQQAALVRPEPLTPIQQALRGVDLDLPAAPVSSPSVPEPAGPSPVAPAATGAFSQPQGRTRGTQAPQTQQTETQGQEAGTDEIAADIRATLEASDRKPAGRNPLAASVEGAQGVQAPGRRSLTDAQVARITAAATDPEQRGKRMPARERRILDALINFGRTYKSFLDAAGNMQRPQQIIKRDTTAEEAVEGRTQRAMDLARDVQAALAELGQAVGGNAKDVDALVATIKAASQGKINTISDPNMIAAYERLDAMISQAWTASKAESFIDNLDMFYTRQEPTRQAREAQDQTPPLVKAAEGQRNPRGQGPTYRGFLGVLHYIRFFGTGYERMLARSLREALVNSKNVPNVEFITEGNSRYDPITNTVFLHQNASNSVTLHEGLHAALQWFVYQNPNSPAVKQLRTSLKAVVGYKGNLGAKAKAVQDLLKKLVAEGNETDAILELVSYGNTLNEFRKALEAMPRKSTPKSFYEAAQDVWQSVLAIVRQLLGGTNNEAAAVIQSTWDLLAEIGDRGITAPPARQGAVLEAAIVMDDMNPYDTPEPKLLRRPGTSAASLESIETYNRRIVPAKVSTKVLFDMIGWDKIINNVDEKLITPLMNKIRNEAPTLTRWISYINANFAVPQDVRPTFQQFKNDKQAGYKVSERLATYVQFQPAEKVNALFAYLDGDTNALKDDQATRELADDVKAWRDFYVQELNDPRAKEFFSRGKFSETMLFATRQEQVAGEAFGVRKLNQLLGQKTEFEPDLETSWLNLDSNGDPMLADQRFYEVLQDINGKRVHAGFIAEAKFKSTGAPIGFTVDPTYLWYHTEKTKRGHKFVANMTAAQAIQEQRADDLANALRNTMAALAGGYASVQFSNSLAQYERGTTNAVAFDSIEQINQLFDVEVDPRTVLNAGSQEARQKRTKHEYRSPHLWVQLPKDAKYGALAGKIVKGSVWSAMNDMSDRQPVVDVRLLNNSMRWFKKAKTIYNVGTHITNVATNISLAMMHDIPMRTLGAATRLFTLYETAPNKLTAQEREIVRAFMNSNAMLGDFSSAEVKEALHDAMVDSLREGASPSLYGRVATMMGFERKKAEAMKKLVGKNLERADQIATEIYAAEDNIFRLAAFMKFAADSAAQNGTPDLQGAGNFAREAFLDYDIDSKAVRIARQTVLPFVSWTYAIIPVLTRIAVHKPWQLANFLLLYTILEHAMQELSGGDEEDERLRRVGPEYIRDRMFNFGPYMHIRIPFLGDDKNPVYYRLGDYNPMASLARGLPNGFMGVSALPSAITPTGPFVSFIAAAVGGVDPYTGKPLSPPTDSDWEKFVDRARYITGQFLPTQGVDTLNWLTGASGSKIDDIIKGRTDRTDNYAALQMARWAGLKLYDYNVGEAELAQFRASKAIMQEYKQEIGKLRRAEARFENPDWESFYARQAELLERMKEEMAKARGEQ